MATRPPATAGQRLEDVDTPALVVDLDALERNVQLMRATLAGTGIRLRPHAKSHKCAEIAKRQLAAGAVGVCCQKVSEAEALVDAGVADVMVSNEVVGAAKLARLARLANRAKVSVCVDDAGNARDLDAAARTAGITLDVFVEVDVGQHRCGAEPGEPAAALASVVRACTSLRFAGLHAYHGGAQHLRSVDERREVVEAAAAKVRDTKALIESRGIACPAITGGGTGTFVFDVASGVYDEVQPGSYVFMDVDYGRNQWTGFPAFEQSLFVWTTVMSTPTPDRAVVDAGLKALAVDSGMPRVWQRAGVEYAKASDEHGVLVVERGVTGPILGERLLLAPGHCDPTVNLYDWIVCARRGVVEALWPVTARGAVW